jgi:hypothetical protein
VCLHNTRQARVERGLVDQRTPIDDLLSAPNSASGKLQRIVLELLREHEQQGEDGLPTNARFLGYELIQRGILSKEEKGARRGDQDLHEALTRLRETRIIPWWWITDETRSLLNYTGWPRLADWATTMVEYIRIDPWRGRAPLVLTESRSLSGVLDKLARRYAIKLAATNGQCGGFLHTDIAPILKPGDRVRYAGDWDWQGGQIEDNTRRVLERLVGGELDLEARRADRRSSRAIRSAATCNHESGSALQTGLAATLSGSH